MNNIIAQINSVSKTFTHGFIKTNVVNAVQNVTFTVEAGEILSLIGPNGAGKTTLIRLLMGFIKPTKGNILLLEKKPSDWSLRNVIGYLPERYKFPQYISAQLFLIYWGSFGGLHGNVLIERVDNLLEFVGIKEKAKSKISTLSKGMKVRLGLAQALLNDPQLLILDEPSEGLDPIARIEFRNLLLSLRMQGKTVIMNSHLLSEVEKVSNRVGILKNGQLIQMENIDNLVSSKKSIQISFKYNNSESILSLMPNCNPFEQEGSWNIIVDNSEKIDELIKRLAAIGASITNIKNIESSFEADIVQLLGT